MRICFRHSAKRYKGLLISLIASGCVYLVFLEGTIFSSVTGKLFIIIKSKLKQRCQQFHQDQQNEQTPLYQTIEHTKTLINGVGNIGAGLK
jgi:hypothetical protein